MSCLFFSVMKAFSLLSVVACVFSAMKVTWKDVSAVHSKGCGFTSVHEMNVNGLILKDDFFPCAICVLLFSC